MITATHINYYFVCRRKLWLFSHNIQCEHDSDTVAMGKLIHESSYGKEKKELLFGPVKLDWINFAKKTVHEVKKSDKVEDAHLWQLKYYLYYLKHNGIGEFTGELNYPKLKKTQTVELTGHDEQELEKIINNINEIIEEDEPPPIRVDKKICKACSYYELCYV